ncbi:hypothetical protein V2A60_009683 [Cordyceps javanica]
MKFGLNYDIHVLPKWSQHYIDYNGLRMQLRARTQGRESIEELAEEFITEIAHLRNFLISRYRLSGAEAGAIATLSSEGPSLGQVSAPSIAPPSTASNHGIARNSIDDERKDLQTFGKLNMVAIRRLLGKFAASGRVMPHSLRRAEAELEEWAEALQRTNQHLNTMRDPSFSIEGRQVRGGTLLNGGSDAGSGSGVKFSDLSEASFPPRDDIARCLEPQSLDEFQLLLSTFHDKDLDSEMEPTQSRFFGRLLYLAATCLPSSFIDAILEHKPDVTMRSSRGETALNCAAQSGSLSVVHSVAGYFLRVGESLDSVVPRTGWTPLTVACAKGYTDVAAYLLSSGADATKADVLGWTAREHAAYRGHLSTASLEQLATDNERGDLAGRVRSSKETSHGTLAAGQKAVIVTLGTVQGGHGRKTLKLRQEIGRSDDVGLESKYLEIIINGSDCVPKIVQLPLWADQSVEPLVGRLDLAAQSQVTVRLWDNKGAHACSPTLESSGTVLLGEEYARFGASRESMLRETTVILLDREDMEYAGTVLLSYVIATPFEGLGNPTTASYKRRPGDPVRLVGHRGLGQNTAGKSNLQIGENTVTAWSAICRDVQLTRDLEAVIYHDFSFSGSGSDVPIHDISLAQYKYAGDIQNPSGALLLEAGTRPRASSTGEHSVLKAMQAQERLRYTVDFDGKGFKANIRGHSIQDAHATLEELFLNLPEEIGFNIEMKYQRLHEAVEAGVASVTIDINTFVDVTLEKIKRLAGRRPIILSSFTPEVCILLKLKQSAYPVMLITNAGKVPMADKELRAASLQMGLQFARCWQLSGIVLACDTFLLCPRLISFVKNAGLVCASYGLGNNDPENAKIQADAGIDILIVDKVKLIADTLGK